MSIYFTLRGILLAISYDWGGGGGGGGGEKVVCFKVKNVHKMSLFDCVCVCWRVAERQVPRVGVSCVSYAEDCRRTSPPNHFYGGGAVGPRPPPSSLISFIILLNVCVRTHFPRSVFVSPPPAGY